ncbi:hypothetical protein LUZ60_009779 [Juncus effusus]|nr:hypothetical protein LUZ60_009779 [Juncus effusus]
MARQPPFSSPRNKRAFLLLALVVSFSFFFGFLLCRRSIPSCSLAANLASDSSPLKENQRVENKDDLRQKSNNPLLFMRGKIVLLVSHELSLSGGPLLLMELAFLLRGVGTKVIWITYPKSDESNDITINLEHKMLSHGVQVISAKGQEAIETALKSDMVILNTAVAGKWLDGILKEKTDRVLPKTLWWIHEMRGHYFTLNYVKHLPNVAAVMIDSHVTAQYWKNRTHDRLKIEMPETHVVHLGNSKELMRVAQGEINTLKEHIRNDDLHVGKDDLLFALINSVSRGKGQDLFLQAFHQSLQIIKSKKIKVPDMRAIIVGSDINVQTKFELELRDFVRKKGIEDRVRFVNKTMNVTPYLAAVDVLIQNSQARGECFGRITIEAMAFQLPVLGTAAGGTTEIVINGTTGILHPVGKDGIIPLANNIVYLATHVQKRVTMGRKGYERVKERFMEHHMAENIARVLDRVLRKSKGNRGNL